jgi:DNA-binding response OmpR family regulator
MSEECILVVDDESDLVWAIQRCLSREGYQVLTAGDGLEALSVAQRHHPSLVILDIIMPYMDGLEVCRRLRLDPTLAATPLIFLSVQNLASNRVTGLDAGGDDYLVKPFDLEELKAHVRALLRRAYSRSQNKAEDESQANTLTIGSMALNLCTRQVQVDEKMVDLTPTEFDLLYFFMTHPGIVFNTQQLLQLIWDYPPDTADPSLVRWHTKNLRAKIEPDPGHPRLLRTIGSHGYMLDRRKST